MLDLDIVPETCEAQEYVIIAVYIRINFHPIGQPVGSFNVFLLYLHTEPSPQVTLVQYYCIHIQPLHTEPSPQVTLVQYYCIHIQLDKYTNIEVLLLILSLIGFDNNWRKQAFCICENKDADQLHI